MIVEKEMFEGKDEIENIYSVIAEKKENSYKLVQFF